MTTVREQLEALADSDFAEITDDEAMDGVVAQTLDHLHALANERWGSVHGVVGFELTHDDELVSDRTITLTARSAKQTPDVDTWDVIVRGRATDMVEVFLGRASAAMLALTGELTMEGDALLALDLAGMFVQPQDDGSLPDAMHLDPSDVASAVKKASDHSLQNVLASTAGPAVMDRVFHRLPDFLNPKKAAKLATCVVFKLTLPDGEAMRYAVHVADGVATVTDGDVEERDATITMKASEFLKLATGNLNAMKAGLTGHIGITGDMASALALSRALESPKAR